MKKCCLLLFLLLLVMGMVAAEAEVIDGFKDVDGWLQTWMEEANWSLTNEKRLDVTLSCAGTEYRSYYWYGFGNSIENGYDDYIGEIELETSCGSSLAVDSATFSVIKNGRSVISQREVADKCTWVVPEAAADMVTMDGNAITFDEPGDLTVTLQYLSLDPWNTVLKKSGSWVKCHIVVTGEDASVKLYSPTTDQEIEKLIHTFGSYSWEGEAEDDFTKLKMELSLVDSRYKILNVDVTLPDGFSFEPNALKTRQTMKLMREDNEKYLVGSETIYPIYSTSRTSKLSYAYDDKKGEAYFPVYTNPEEGIIKMRPTTAVNRADSSPFWIKHTAFKPEVDFTGNSAVYSQNLAEIACMLSQSVYNKNWQENKDTAYITESFHNLGFSKFLWQASVDKHDVAVGFALKKVIADGKVYNVIAVAVRGTVGFEWIGNFNVTDGTGFSADFHKCAQNVNKRLQDYIDACKIPDSTLKLFICGHSRAGAVVDYAAHVLNGVYDPKNIYAYTFAAPNVTKVPEEDANIINIVYKYDFVPYVPLDYGKYGVTVVLGGEHWDDAPEAVKQAFTRYTNGNEYHHVGSDFFVHFLMNFPDLIKSASSYAATTFQNLLGFIIAEGGVSDNFIAKAHGAENYCAWVIANGINKGETFDYFIKNKLKNKKQYDQSFKRLPLITKMIMGGAIQILKTDAGRKTVGAAVCVYVGFNIVKNWDDFLIYAIHCPVNISIKDDSGKSMGSFTNHAEKTPISSKGVITVGDGESSFILVPKGIGHTITITGTDEGTMTIDYAYVNEAGDILGEESITEIPVHKGEKFTLNAQPSVDGMPLVISSTGAVYASGISDKIMLLPADLTSIEDEAFAGLEVEKVVIPASCEYVGHRAFANCKSLKIVQFIDGDNVDVEEDFLKGSPNARIVAPEGSYMAAW